jgi:flavodoxin
MRTLIVYASIAHGNTEKIAAVMNEVFGGKLARPKEITFEEVDEYDLIGFGSGIYAQRPHYRLLRFVHRLPTQTGKKAFLFFTSGARDSFLLDIFTKPLRSGLLKKGFDIVGEFRCPGLDTFGPFWFIRGINKGRPDERDFDNARNFARGLLSDLEAGSLAATSRQPKSKGESDMQAKRQPDHFEVRGGNQ